MSQKCAAPQKAAHTERAYAFRFKGEVYAEYIDIAQHGEEYAEDVRAVADRFVRDRAGVALAELGASADTRVVLFTRDGRKFKEQAEEVLDA